MPSSQKFRDHVVEQFKGELRVTTRKMMGEYILYADGKVFGGIYDDRLLVKPVPAALKLLPGAKKQLPYEGAKPMLRITAEQIEDSGLLVRLLDAMLPELPASAKKR
jgi:TfoX/Sxy family transcriptional regulator of competence genes